MATQLTAVIKQKLSIKKVSGIDIAKAGVNEAKKKGIDGICMDIDTGKIPLRDNSVDFIFCGEIIEHLYSPDHLLSEIFRILKPNGKLALTTLI